ncbi:MCE family protein [Actinocorallia sp. API 0066]|uniref:MlaD family protein n=1 Tax=Actinocorallia sp. API 0066 TaxID=2896846 RepID=UPI001E4B7883|nr:MlaD family protein [Actinocorallia sp. API 0066]MCD0451448.1 MCE family protein [Actinocorallia sp. API 0066]
MNGRRVQLNVAVFATLTVALTAWALTNVVRFDFVERPYTITAEFSASPGLNEGFEVAYLGVRVGKIRSLRLDAPRHRVVTELAIDRGVRIPSALTAAAGRKSAVGEPYVSLAPRPGADLDDHIRPGGVIPQEHTSVPIAYGDLFARLVEGLEETDPASTRILLREMAEGFEGRADSIRQIIDGADSISTAFAGRTELIDGLVADLSVLSGTLARNSGALGDGIGHSAALLGPLADLRAELAELLERSPGFSTRLAGLTVRTQPYVGCGFEGLAAGFGAIATPESLAGIRGTLTRAAPLIAALKDIIQVSPEGSSINMKAAISVTGTAPLQYKTPRPIPSVPDIPSCSDGADPFKSQPTATKPDRNGQGAPAPSASAAPPSPGVTTTAVARPAAGNTAGGPPGWLVWLPPVLALAVLARVAARSLPVVLRRRR